MAVIPYTVVVTPVSGQSLKLVKWLSIGAGNTGQPYVVAPYTDKTVQLVNTGGAGVTIEGSLDPDGATWHTLNDPQGNALSGVTSDKTENVLEHCYLLRPSGQGDVWLLLASVR